MGGREEVDLRAELEGCQAGQWGRGQLSDEVSGKRNGRVGGTSIGAELEPEAQSAHWNDRVVVSSYRAYRSLEGIRAAGQPASSVGLYRRGREELAIHRWHSHYTHTSTRLTLNPTKTNFHLGFTRLSEFLSPFFLSFFYWLKGDLKKKKNFHTFFLFPPSSKRKQG